MRRSALVLVAAVAALNVMGGTVAAREFYDCGEGYYYSHRCGGFVIPCSLDGINPAYHPWIFGSPKTAREEYGFIRSRDGTWHVEKNCVRGPYHGG
jgi:hypothetical protein